jgi:hypothetical protein
MNLKDVFGKIQSDSRYIFMMDAFFALDVATPHFGTDPSGGEGIRPSHQIQKKRVM